MSRSRKYWAAAIGVAAVLVTAAAPAQATQSRPASSDNPGCVDGAVVFHAVRDGDGSWTNFNPPNPQPPLTCIEGIAAATAPDGAHFDVIGEPGGLYDTVRHADGSWSNWDPPPQPPGTIQHIAMTNDQYGNLLYVASTTTGVYYNARNASTGGYGSTWYPVSGRAVPDPGFVTYVAVASSGNTTQYMIVDGGVLYHSLYDNIAGGWTNWAQPVQPPCGAESVAGATLYGNATQWLVVSLCNGIYHAARYVGGAWSNWDPVPGQPELTAGDTLGAAAGATDGDGDAQFTVQRGNSDGTSTHYHTVRYVNGDWSGFAPPAQPSPYCGPLAVAAPYQTGSDVFEFATYCW